MIAAIYARKSTDQHVADEEKSVTRQVERARAYATRKGWTVDDAHVYTDDGISGAEFLKRPRLLALMNALKPRPAFGVLIVMDQSRLGREQDEIPYALRKITNAGVRVFSYLRDAELQRATAADKFMINAMAFVDEMAKEQASARGTPCAATRSAAMWPAAPATATATCGATGTSSARLSPPRPP